MKFAAFLIFKCCFTEQSSKTLPVKTNIIGGDVAYVAALGLLDLENPEQNQAMYTKWAGSVKDFPQVIKQKVCLNEVKQNLQISFRTYK